MIHDAITKKDMSASVFDRFKQFPIPDISKHTCCSSLVSLPANRSQRNMLAGAAIALRYLCHLGYDM